MVGDNALTRAPEDQLALQRRVGSPKREEDAFEFAMHLNEYPGGLELVDGTDNDRLIAFSLLSQSQGQSRYSRPTCVLAVLQVRQEILDKFDLNVFVSGRAQTLCKLTDSLLPLLDLPCAEAISEHTESGPDASGRHPGLVHVLDIAAAAYALDRIN